MTDTVVRTRFAPSPTGFMHIGNLRTALYAFLLAKSNGGQFILRIEDTDQERQVEGAVEVILKTLEMTGLSYDEGPIIGGEHGPYVQSERKPIYQEYAKKLVELGHAYYCFCSEERLKSLHDENGLGGYDRHCRNLSPEEVQRRLDAGESYVIRQKIPLEGVTSYVDEVFGEISVENKEMQDQILLKADGFPTYNFAHVIDDYLMGVTHVVRGSEYLTSTPKYVLLYDAFGWPRPHYVHLPLLMGRGADGTVSKLSKRHGAVSFQDLVNDGYLPEAIVNYISLLGWSPSKNNEDEESGNEEFFTLPELIERFSMKGLSKSPSVFDYDKLKWFNAEYIRRMSPEAYAEKVVPMLEKICPAGTDLNALAELLHSRVSTLNEATEMVDFVEKRLPLDSSAYINKKNKTTVEGCKAILTAMLPRLEACEDWNNDALYNALKDYAAEAGLKLGAVVWAVRIAIARKTVTPGGATELMTVFGKAETLDRIRAALAELE